MSTRSPITTHVLDIALGKPASGIAVQLERLDAAGPTVIARGATDADGRASQLLAPGTLVAGTHRIRFDLDAYFAQSQRAAFYPYVEIVFVVRETDEHYHVPLLLSPHGYSTYRGS